MDNSATGEIADSWDLLAKAESRCRLGLISEALIAADEAIEAGLRTCFDELGSPLPSDRKEALRVLRREGVKVPAQSVLRIGELRKRAERSAEKEDVSPSEAEEAISTAENLLTEINEKHFHRATRERENEFILPVNTPDLVRPFRPLHESIAQVEPEFVAKLLLARAILNTKKKRVPHLIGVTVTALSALTCLLFSLLGGAVFILSITGSSFFSVFGLVFAFALLLIAYIFLKLAVYVKGETRWQRR